MSVTKPLFYWYFPVFNRFKTVENGFTTVDYESLVKKIRELSKLWLALLKNEKPQENHGQGPEGYTYYTPWVQYTMIMQYFTVGPNWLLSLLLLINLFILVLIFKNNIYNRHCQVGWLQTARCLWTSCSLLEKGIN